MFKMFTAQYLKFEINACVFSYIDLPGVWGKLSVVATSLKFCADTVFCG